jgi:hypothetical protein
MLPSSLKVLDQIETNFFCWTLAGVRDFGVDPIFNIAAI